VVVTAETGFQIAHDPDTVRAPDVAFVRADRVPSGGVEAFFEGPPDLAVEVISPIDRARDVAAKAQNWLEAGCATVWVVDPKRRTVAVYRSPKEVDTLSSADTLVAADVLPGFCVPVGDLFA
jgi:Uma2 family endonuclease